MRNQVPSRYRQIIGLECANAVLLFVGKECQAIYIEWGSHQLSGMHLRVEFPRFGIETKDHSSSPPKSLS